MELLFISTLIVMWAIGMMVMVMSADEITGLGDVFKIVTWPLAVPAMALGLALSCLYWAGRRRLLGPWHK